ncbi:hypothetical protein PIB30_044911 [Stylosanthes scabra]|uniref:Uncharacterized protein n=1 Tax=Stylosanthes scabra TaxID=79078 RepID=A0ABU6WE04_9FABA|nr:hypothetical protein [Stylosanthes scabra]
MITTIDPRVVVAASSFLSCRWCLYHCCSLPQLRLCFKLFEEARMLSVHSRSEKLEATRKKMKAPNELHVIDGGDHSFKIGKKHLQANDSTQEEAEELALKAIATFILKSPEGQ